MRRGIRLGNFLSLTPSSFIFTGPHGSALVSQPEKCILTGCSVLQQIQFRTVAIKRPCDFVSLTLSTVDSLELNKVILDIGCGEVNCQRKFDTDVDLASWTQVDQVLCTLAEKVGTVCPTAEFEVAVRVKGSKEVVRAINGSRMFNGLRKKSAVTVSQWPG